MRERENTYDTIKYYKLLNADRKTNRQAFIVNFLYFHIFLNILIVGTLYQNTKRAI